jgi:hypothetical protein
MYNDIRVCDTPTLIRLAYNADKCEFNRRIDTEEFEKVANPNIINVLALILPYHRAGFGPSREPIWPDHHRCEVHTSVIQDGEESTVVVYLDVAVKDWDDLMTLQQFEDKMNDPIEMGIAYARAAANSGDDD